MNTTNGTRAFLAVEAAECVLATSFVNVSAVARRLAGVEDLLVVCAGREDRFALEDAVCAGALLRELSESGAAGLDDAARAAYVMAGRFSPNSDFLAATEAGRRLVELDLRSDLEWCARRDSLDIVPEMRDRAIVPVEA